MSHILRKVMSLRSLSRPSSPPEPEVDDTLVDMQDADTATTQPLSNFDPIPNFAQQGITDPTTIVLELMKGPAASIHLGKDAHLITLPKRLLIYYSPIAAHLLTATDTLSLPHDDPVAFAHICNWMHRGSLCILSHRTRADFPTGIQHACTLLCRVYATARYLDIAAIKTVVLDELTAATAVARDMGMSTPILPGLVLEVWEEGGGEDGALWGFVVREMCKAFSGRPSPVYGVYEGCFGRIDGLRVAVAGAMADRILGAGVRGVGVGGMRSWSRRLGTG